MNDNFRWVDPDEAVFAGCICIAVVAATFVDEKPQPVPVAPECEITIAQYGPGERWAPNHHKPVCAGNAAALPAHVLSFPIKEQQ